MISGYARYSALDKTSDLEGQQRTLVSLGCERVIVDHRSISTTGIRKKLEELLGNVQEGDVVMATTADRLARSTADLLDIATRLKARGASLVVGRIGDASMDTRTAAGRQMLKMLAAVSEFERSLVLERQREGIARAAAAGRYRGNAPAARRHAEAVQKLRGEGLGVTEIVRRTGVSRASVYRILQDVEEATP